MSTGSLIQSYYASLNRKDNQWQDLYSEDAYFSGQKLHQDDAEVWEVQDGKLAKLTIFFDLTAYRAFMTA